MKAKGNRAPISTNRKAFHDYFIHETYEAGIVLTGTEVKSIRQGRVNLRDSFVRIQGSEIWLWNTHISPYEQGNRFNQDPLRTRKLLLHRKEINKIHSLVQTKGYTIIPLKLYIKNGYAKLLIGVAKGKKNYDKRHVLKQKEANKEINRVLKDKQKY